MLKENCCCIAGLDVTLRLNARQKYIYLRVDPPEGRVRISAPCHVNVAELERCVLEHYDAIVQMQEEMRRSPQPERYADGGQYCLWGKAYPLQLHSGTERHLSFDGASWHMQINAEADDETRSRLFSAFYRTEMQRAVPPLLAAYEAKMAVQVAEWRLRDMKTRWGSCSIHARSIRLNVHLAKLPPVCLEYVIVHELTHLFEKYHDDRFYARVERYVPAWRDIEQRMAQKAPRMP